MGDPADKLVLSVAQLAFATGEWAQLARERQCFQSSKKKKKSKKKTFSSLWRGDIVAYNFFFFRFYKESH